MGGRGGASGMRGKAATGGRSGNVTIVGRDGSERTARLTSFSGNDGMVQELAIGTNVGFTPQKSKLDVTKYDFVISPSLNWNVTRVNYEGIANSNFVIGINMAMPQGVSEKQQNYAKAVLKQHLEPTIQRGIDSFIRGEMTADNVIQQVKKMPKLNAREILDKWRR